MSKNKRIKRLNLGNMPSGEPVFLTTASGNEYVIVRATRSERTDFWVTRVLVTSQSSSSVTRYGAQVETNRALRDILLGQPFMVDVTSSDGIVLRANTSSIVEIRVNGDFDGAFVRC